MAHPPAGPSQPPLKMVYQTAACLQGCASRMLHPAVRCPDIEDHEACIGNIPKPLWQEHKRSIEVHCNNGFHTCTRDPFYHLQGLFRKIDIHLLIGAERISAGLLVLFAPDDPSRCLLIHIWIFKESQAEMPLQYSFCRQVDAVFADLSFLYKIKMAVFSIYFPGLN
jgi:hypothetical protein